MKQNILKIISQCLNEKVPSYFVSHLGIKKSNTIYLVLLILLVGLAACDSFMNKPSSELFDPHEHPVLKTGDTLVFIGSTNVDTLLVGESEFYKPYQPDHNHDNGYEVYYAAMYNDKYYADTMLNFVIEINPWSYSLRYYYQFKKQTDPLASISSYKAGTDTLEINIGDTTLNNIYKAVFVKELYSHLFVEVDTAYYSKTYGFVKYVKYTGEVFVISEETLEMLMERD
jgi:hypothetical protein